MTDPSYMDCLRAYRIKLHWFVVIIYNKRTLLNSANLVSRDLRVSRDQQLRIRSIQSCQSFKDVAQVLYIARLQVITHTNSNSTYTRSGGWGSCKTIVFKSLMVD